MWSPDKSKLVKVRLSNRGEDVETPWAEDLGPDPSDPEKRRVRLANVPFLHSKPTYGDVLQVEEVDGWYAWDAEGVDFEQIPQRIAEDGGRWAMIIDYRLPRGVAADLGRFFQHLNRHAEREDLVVEGAFVDEDGRGGRAYVAVPASLSVPTALAILSGGEAPFELTLVHPIDDE